MNIRKFLIFTFCDWWIKYFSYNFFLYLHVYNYIYHNEQNLSSDNADLQTEMAKLRLEQNLSSDTCSPTPAGTGDPSSILSESHSTQTVQ